MNTLNPNLKIWLLKEIRNNNFDEVINKLIPVEPSGDQSNQTFFHLGTVNKLGVNPQTIYNTPFGIYAYPLTTEYYDKLKDDRLPFAGGNPYIQIFKLKPNSKLLLLSSYNNYNEDADKILSWVKTQPEFIKSLSKNYFFKIRKNAISLFVDLSQDQGIEFVDNKSFAKGLESTNLLKFVLSTEFPKFLKQKFFEVGITEEHILKKIINNFIITLFVSNSIVEKSYEKTLEKLVNDFFLRSKETASLQLQGSQIWNLSRSVASSIALGKYHEDIKQTPKSHAIWTYILKNVLGYDAAIDYGMGIIHSNEPTQACIFNPASIIRIETVYNKYSNNGDPTVSTSGEFKTQRKQSVKYDKQTLITFKSFFEKNKQQAGLEPTSAFSLENFSKFIANIPVEIIQEKFSKENQMELLKFCGGWPHTPSQTEKLLFESLFTFESLYDVFYITEYWPQVYNLFQTEIQSKFVSFFTNFKPNTIQSLYDLFGYIKQSLKIKNKSKWFFVKTLQTKLPPIPSTQTIVNLLNNGSTDAFAVALQLFYIDAFIKGTENTYENTNLLMNKFLVSFIEQVKQQNLKLEQKAFKELFSIYYHDEEARNMINQWAENQTTLTDLTNPYSS